MPTTRKKKIQTVYKNDDDSEGDKSVGDFSDSGSEAEIPEASSSDEAISDDDFEEVPVKTFSKAKRQKPVKKTKFTKTFLNKLNKQSDGVDDAAMETATPAPFSVKDLTEEDKLLPSFLDLSESDSSDDDSPKAPPKKSAVNLSSQVSDDEMQVDTEYKDVWSQNINDNSEEVAKRTFMDLEKQKLKAEETKESILNYNVAMKNDNEEITDVKDLLAMGEEVTLQSRIKIKKNRKTKKAKDDSDSEIEDWEEVNEAQQLPQQGLQLVVDFPDAQYRKKKTIDVEMMMKRKINRVKKEYQVYMHKVHVLCWLGHGNYVSKILNDQEVLSAALSLVPSKECYPGERVDMKYVEQITSWFKDKLTLKQDKNEEKFRAKALPLKEILKNQIKTRIVTAKKYLVFIFVSMLRALGLQCRVMFNFTTLPIRPPSSELCSLSTKQKDEKKVTENKEKQSKSQVKKKCSDSKIKAKKKISQFDGNCDSSCSESDNGFDSDIQDIMQLDGNDDTIVSTRRTRKTRTSTKENTTNEDVSPPKRAKPEIPNSVQDVKNNKISKPSKDINIADKINVVTRRKGVQKKSNYDENKSKLRQENASKSETGQQQNKKAMRKGSTKMEVDMESTSTLKSPQVPDPTEPSTSMKSKQDKLNKKMNPPKIIITQEDENSNVSSKFFDTTKVATKKLSISRTQTQTGDASLSQTSKSQPDIEKDGKSKLRTRSAPRITIEKSKYFDNNEASTDSKKSRYTRATEAQEDKQRVSHRDILAKTKKPSNDVTGDLVDIIKMRVKEAKAESKKGKIKGKIKESDEDSDYLPNEEPKPRKSESDDDFKPKKISPRPSTSRVVKKIDRRVLSSDSDDLPKNKIDFWCEVFVEELEQWIAVDVIKAKAHCTNEIYSHATHPVCYIVGWDNNNFLKDLTRRYVPHWNTVTRKQRVEPMWWETAIKPWLGPKTARDREEDEQLDRMQLDAPLPKSITEYKNHPLYALKRHLLKFEAIYPPDAATLGFVRNEAVYARECVYVCRSRDIWLKEAKVVRLGEKPYKIVKARPKWDRLSNKLITDKPLEIFGPWQVDDYEPPVAENGVVPRNAYGNVELFKECMLPKGTVHIKLPGLNRVAKKLNIDCAPAMTGFDFNGGWSHPVYDGFVVCQEFEQIITEAWLKDQEEQERREREKLENRVYGNWKRLIKGLFIRERLKNKYGFDDPKQPEKKNKGPKLVVKKK